jgi:hypothetical protein
VSGYFFQYSGKREWVERLMSGYGRGLTMGKVGVKFDVATRLLDPTVLPVANEMVG